MGEKMSKQGLSGDKGQQEERTAFLSSLAVLLKRYNLDWREDIDIDFDTMTISLKVDLQGRVLLDFVSDLEKLTGKLR